MIEETIKKELFRITGNIYKKSEIEKKYLPIFKKIKSKKMLMISGSQGSGKSTLSMLIKNVLKREYNKSVTILSIDDFYLSMRKRKDMAKKKHPLFKTRGVPGTHDLALLKEVLFKLKKNKYPIFLPSFDKIKDNRKKNKKKISSSDCIILEGWFVGARPLPENILLKNINKIDKHFDKQGEWRMAYNSYLKQYQAIFKMFNLYIFLLTPSWGDVIKWKYKQELKIRNEKKNFKLLLNLKEFILYYEKITRWMMKTSKAECDILIKLNNKQEFKQIIYKPKNF